MRYWTICTVEIYDDQIIFLDSEGSTVGESDFGTLTEEPIDIDADVAVYESTKTDGWQLVSDEHVNGCLLEYFSEKII